MKPPTGCFSILMFATIMFAVWPWSVFWLLSAPTDYDDKLNIWDETGRIVAGPNGVDRCIRVITKIQ